MNVLFAGSPGIAVESLKFLHRHATICGVLTSPDKPAGRGRKVYPSPVKAAAEELGLPVLQPPRLNRQARDEIKELKPNLLAVFAYSKIFGPKFLALFDTGAVNVHPSLLPKYRGPSPIPAAILAGERKTGVTVQQIGLEMDAGDILLQEEIDIEEHETSGELTDRIAPVGARLLVETVKLIEAGEAKSIRQNNENATYCSLIRKEDGRIDWREGADRIACQVRAYNPWPMAFTSYNNLTLVIRKACEFPGDISKFSDDVPGTVCGVDKENGILVKTNKGILSVKELQLQSRKALGWREFLNGTPGFLGSLLGGE